MLRILITACVWNAKCLKSHLNTYGWRATTIHLYRPKHVIFFIYRTILRREILADHLQRVINQLMGKCKGVKNSRFSIHMKQKRYQIRINYCRIGLMSMLMTLTSSLSDLCDLQKSSATENHSSVNVWRNTTLPLVTDRASGGQQPQYQFGAFYVYLFSMAKTWLVSEWCFPWSCSSCSSKYSGKQQIAVRSDAQRTDTGTKTPRCYKSPYSPYILLHLHSLLYIFEEEHTTSPTLLVWFGLVMLFVFHTYAVQAAVLCGCTPQRTAGNRKYTARWTARFRDLSHVPRMLAEKLNMLIFPHESCGKLWNVRKPRRPWKNRIDRKTIAAFRWPKY